MLEALAPLRRLLARTPMPYLLLGTCTLFAVVETGVGLWVPLLVRELLEAAASGTVPRSQVLLIGGAILAEAAAGAVTLYLLARAGERVTAFLRNRLVHRLLRLPMKFHDDRQSGELVSRAMSDTTSVQSLLTDHSIALVAGVLAMTGATVILWFLDWRLTLVLFSTSLLGVLLVVPIAVRLHAVGVATQDELGSWSGRLAAVLGEMRLVKSTCAEAQEEERAATAIDRLRQLGLREARILAVLGPTVTLGISGALVVILGYGGARVASGELTVGTLVAFILYLFQIVMPMVQMSTFVAALSKAGGAAAHLSALLDEPLEEPGGDRPLPRGGARAIRFDGVTHSYDAEQPVLHDFNLEIPAGKVTALVGPSGGGKTTVLALVERFYEPEAGTIRLGDIAIGDFALEEWRRAIGYVAQEAPLLAGTLHDNLCIGLESEPSQRHIEEALTAARASQFVGELADGLATEVGERGVKLSGGQRQRIAIARAFLSDPQLLILDEATANLDSESELGVREALRELMRGRTTIVVAHRLATVVDADQIAVVEDGRVTATGTHRTLLEQHETYRQLVEGQKLGFAHQSPVQGGGLQATV